MNPVAFDTDDFLRARVIEPAYRDAVVKPCIRLVRGRWCCRSLGFTGFGATPSRAYAMWLMAKAPW